MKNRRLYILLLIMSLLLVGCGKEDATPAPTEKANKNKLPPPIVVIKPGDTTQITPTVISKEQTVIYDTVYITTAELVSQEDSPVPHIHLVGNLPTSCHILYIKVSEPDNKGNIQIKVYSSVRLGVDCEQKKVPFEQMVVIDEVPSGEYTIWVQGTKIGHFTVP